MQFPWITRGGKVVTDGGAIAISTICCCPTCCDRLYPPGATPEHLPSTLTLTITNVTDCGCVDGLVIILTWDLEFKGWIGTGPGGEICALLSEEWRIGCSLEENPNPAEGNCQFLEISIAGFTSCIMAPEFPLPGCTCEPIYLEYDLHVDGLSCCDGAPDGQGDIHVVVTE